MSDMSSGTNTASASSLPESLMDFSIVPPSSATSEHSSLRGTPRHIRAWLMSSLAGSLASRSLHLANSLPQTTPVTCGLPRGTLFALFDQSTSYWRTLQGCLDLGTPQSSRLIWPRWATWGPAGAFQQQTWALTTNATVSGLLRTPMASDNRNRGNVSNPSIQRRMRIGKQVSLSMLFEGEMCPSCVEAMMGWPIGWSDLAPLETDKFRQWWQAHGGCCHD